MSAARVLRTLRQKRLREVGEAGQARLFAAQATVTEDGLRGEFAVRYLVGAGVSELAAPESLHADAQAIDPETTLSPAQVIRGAELAPDFVLDPAARAAFAGALDALSCIRRVLDDPS